MVVQCCALWDMSGAQGEDKEVEVVLAVDRGCLQDNQHALSVEIPLPKARFS